MALRRKGPVAAPGVPVELLDRSHPVWRSAASAEVWAEGLGLTLRPDTYGPLSRHRDAVRAWALAEGITVFYGRSPRASPDLVKLREMGIPEMGMSAEFRLRLFKVPIDWRRETKTTRQEGNR